LDEIKITDFILVIRTAWHNCAYNRKAGKLSARSACPIIPTVSAIPEIFLL
jgi:hypothetical protein